MKLKKTTHRANKTPIDSEVLEYMETFQWAYQQAANDLLRMQDLQRTYDNVVDPNEWPTFSEIPIPMLFNMVEKALPSAMEFLFPNDKFIRLNPVEHSVDIDSVRKAEWALESTVRHKVKLHKEALRTVKDSFKLGIGYGIVEPYIYTPQAAFIKRALVNGDTVRQARTLDIGTPTKGIRYRYVTAGQVIVTPDGTRFNGHNTPSIRYFVDTYSENEFRKLFKEDSIDTESVVLEGDAEEIIAEAREAKFHSRTSIADTIARLAGIDIGKFSGDDKYAPVRIPVLKIYEDNKHTWIANGTVKVFQEESTFQTMRCPLVKASGYPDGQRWYPMSPVEAAHSMSLGINLFYNATFDLLTHLIKPVALYDKNKFPDGAPERRADGSIGVAGGPVRDAYTYMDTPQIPSQLFTIGDMMSQKFGDTVNQSSSVDQGSPGLLRGGAFAFESLLQSSTGRDRLVGAILESDFLEDAISQILLYMQISTSDEDQVFASREVDKETGEEYIKRETVTPDDLVNAYELELTLKEKHRATAANFAAKQADLQNGLNSPYTDKYNVWMDYYGDEARAKRLLKPREIVEQLEEDQREAELLALASGGGQSPPTGQGPVSTQADQAASGALATQP